MGKNKNKQERVSVSASETMPSLPAGEPGQRGVPCAAEPGAEALPPPGTAPEQPPALLPVAPPAPSAQTAQPQSRFRRGLPDLLKAGAALAVISIAAAIWYQPPLALTDFPYVSYRFQGQTFTDAQLFRPLAMPTRYYIRLPKLLADRYEWFAVDRRREVAALARAPSHRFLGRDAVKRSDPLGLDLEFRKLDHSEWQVHFLRDAVVFSNAVLAVRMETQRTPGEHR